MKTFQGIQSLKVQTVYKIVDTNTWLFSTGGVSPKWTRAGKTWSTLAHLKAHLRNYSANYPHIGGPPRPIPESWTIISYEVKTVSQGQIPASQVDTL